MRAGWVILRPPAASQFAEWSKKIIRGGDTDLVGVAQVITTEGILIGPSNRSTLVLGPLWPKRQKRRKMVQMYAPGFEPEAPTDYMGLKATEAA
jgi:hypothetical protein